MSQAAVDVGGARAPSFGSYELLGKLASGGMASIYLVRRLGKAEFRRMFALKLMHEHLSDDERFVAMLIDEARVVSGIHHPNVVPIVDLGIEGRRHYVVMDYIEGCSLAELLKRHRDNRPARLIAAIIVDVLNGLHAAHVLTDDDDQLLGLVHRDVSPENILIGVDGVARITDFGVAKSRSHHETTRPGIVKGKAPYLAPEQLREDAIVDARSDIFAAGAVLWSALNGVRLFRGPSPEATIRNVLTKEVVAPSTVGLRPPASFDEVCRKALARNPAERYQTAAEMAQALRDAASAEGAWPDSSDVAAWIKNSFGAQLRRRREAIRDQGRLEVPAAEISRLPGPAGGPDGGETEPTIAASEMVRRSYARRVVWAFAMLAPLLAVGWLLAAPGASGPESNVARPTAPRIGAAAASAAMNSPPVDLATPAIDREQSVPPAPEASRVAAPEPRATPHDVAPAPIPLAPRTPTTARPSTSPSASHLVDENPYLRKGPRSD